ncbi:hypothetical protein LCGC14_1641580 [marine sediment metagenome]|uniref:RNA polymerase sigma-70 domain-containing protein n=1 Tax=marine sediment metagenome TaxID=412755 RepID=A0A0F9I043_9ZZZZ
MIAAPLEIRHQSDRPPTVTVLTDGEQRLCDSIPSPIDCVQHPSFTSPLTEEQLFGPAAPDIHVPPYVLLPEVPDDSAPSRPARVPLTVEQERTLFLQYNYCRHRLARLQALQGRSFSTRRSREMAMWYGRALDVRAKLARANLALVPAMAKRMNVPRVELGGLISEGYMVILRCVDHFDASRGFRFSTYACRSLLRAFGRLARKISRYNQFFWVRFDPSVDRGDLDDWRDEKHRLDNADAVRTVLQAVEEDLSTVERMVIMERFGLRSSGKCRTVAQVGAMVGLKADAVRRVQVRAIAKIRSAVAEQRDIAYQGQPGQG